jgi:hypothetical protein
MLFSSCFSPPKLVGKEAVMALGNITVWMINDLIINLNVNLNAVISPCAQNLLSNLNRTYPFSELLYTNISYWQMTIQITHLVKKIFAKLVHANCICFKCLVFLKVSGPRKSSHSLFIWYFYLNLWCLLFMWWWSKYFSLSIYLIFIIITMLLIRTLVK